MRLLVLSELDKVQTLKLLRRYEEAKEKRRLSNSKVRSLRFLLASSDMDSSEAKRVISTLEGMGIKPGSEEWEEALVEFSWWGSLDK